MDNSIFFLDYIANLLTFGWLRFDEIIPVGKPTTLKLYFKNISEANYNIEETKTVFNIKYPGDIGRLRRWNITIPKLNSGDCYLESSESFFCPEVPGIHELEIYKLNGLVYAGPYGVAGRKYRIPEPGSNWFFAFHVSSGHEFRGLTIAFSLLSVGIISLILTLLLRNQ